MDGPLGGLIYIAAVKYLFALFCIRGVLSYNKYSVTTPFILARGIGCMRLCLFQTRDVHIFSPKQEIFVSDKQRLVVPTAYISYVCMYIQVDTWRE